MTNLHTAVALEDMPSGALCADRHGPAGLGAAPLAICDPYDCDSGHRIVAGLAVAAPPAENLKVDILFAGQAAVGSTATARFTGLVAWCARAATAVVLVTAHFAATCAVQLVAYDVPGRRLV